jgi:hypothetical protein
VDRHHRGRDGGDEGMAVKRLSHFGAYLMIVAVALVGFVRIQQVEHHENHNLTIASKQRAKDLCQVVTNDRAVLRVFVDQIAKPTAVLPNATPDRASQIRGSNAGLARLQEFADKFLQPPNCATIISGDPIPLPPLPPLSP